jgi:hypothetical protein
MGGGSLTSIAIRSGFSFLRPLGRERHEANVASASELQHVFLIAGPSGSGKSTFMREFVFDRLPRDISDYLPEQAKSWQRTSGNELSRKGLSRILRAKGRGPGLVVHYDIMRACSRGFEHYANDPAMQALIGAKAALTVMTLLPSREVLFEQFIKRARNDEYEEWWDKKRLIRPLKRKLRGALHKLTGRSPKLLKQGHLVLLGVYGSEHGLNHWTTRWEAFLDSVRRDRDDVRLLYVAPEPVQADYPRFRLLRRV